MGAPGGAPLSLPFTGPKPGEEPNQFGSLNQTLGAIPPGQSSFGPVAPPMAPGMAPGMVTPPSLPPDAMQSGQDPMSALAAMMLPGFMQLIQGMPPAEQEPVPPEASGGGWREGLAGLIKGAAGGIMGQPTRGSDYLEGRQAQRAGMGEKRLEAEERNRLRREQSSGTKREMAQRGIEKLSEEKSAMALAGAKGMIALTAQEKKAATDEDLLVRKQNWEAEQKDLDRELSERQSLRDDQLEREKQADRRKDQENAFSKYGGMIAAGSYKKFDDLIGGILDVLDRQKKPGAGGKGRATEGPPQMFFKGQQIVGKAEILQHIKTQFETLPMESPAGGPVPEGTKAAYVAERLKSIEKALW